MQARVPIVGSIFGSWVDAGRAIRAMPAVIFSALAIYAVVAFVMYFAAGAILMNPGRSLQQWLSSPTWFVFTLFNTSIQIVLIAPLVMAIHRYVLRGEVVRTYPLHPLRPSYLQYVGVALAFNFLYRVPELAVMPVQGIPMLHLLVWLGMVPLFIALLIGASRKVGLLAAIATNAPNASWRKFPLADGGNTFRTIAVLIGVLAPGALAAALLNVYLPIPNWPHDSGGLVLSYSQVLVQVVMLIVFGAAVARIHTAVGTRKAEAPEGAGAPAHA